MKRTAGQSGHRPLPSLPRATVKGSTTLSPYPRLPISRPFPRISKVRRANLWKPIRSLLFRLRSTVAFIQGLSYSRSRNTTHTHIPRKRKCAAILLTPPRASKIGQRRLRSRLYSVAKWFDGNFKLKCSAISAIRDLKCERDDGFLGL